MNVDDPVELVEQTKQGSTQAFSRIVRLYQSRVRAYLARFVRDSNVVEDLAQDTFVRAYRGLAQFRAESSLGVWLLGIARNLALMHLREESRRKSLDSELLKTAVTRWLVGAVESDEGRLGEHEQTLAALETCLQALPEHSAGLVEDYYFKGRSASEMARRSGRKESAVWMTLLRIREILRRCIRTRLSGTEAHA